MGIPTVKDRIVQQALAQVLTPMYEKVFSESSYGFRPNRSAHDALRRGSAYVEGVYGIVVDLDLEKFFDKVNHDRLMARLARDLRESRVLRLNGERPPRMGKSGLLAGSDKGGYRMAGTPQASEAMSNKRFAKQGLIPLVISR